MKAVGFNAIGLIDALQSTIFVIISLLVFTGGFIYRSENVKLELSQVDAFAITLFLLTLLRKKTSGDYFSEPIRKFSDFLYDLFNNNSKFTLITITGTYLFLMSWVQIWRFDSFHANAYDLGYVDQAIYCTGRCATTLSESFLHSNLSRNNTYLGEHFSPILAVFSPLYSILDSAYLLFFIQTLFLAAGALLVYRIARLYHVNRGIATALSACYLLYQPLRSANTFDLREDNLFIFFILSSVYAFITKRILIFWITAILTFFVKENAGILNALLALIIIFSRELFPDEKSARKHGIALLIASAVIFIVTNQVLTPHFSGNTGKTMLASRLGTAIAENDGIFSLLLQKPLVLVGILLKNIVQKSTFKYFLVVFVPFLVAIRHSPLPLLAAGMLFMLYVALGITGVGFHYECALIPFAFLGMIQTARKVNLNFGLLLLSFLLFYGRSPVLSLREFSPSDHDVMVKEELHKIPKDASIATQSSLHPHLTHRKTAKLLSGVPDTDYVIVDFSEGKSLYGTPNIYKDVEALDKSVYEKVVDRDRFLVFRRRHQVSNQD